jgi:hypothetical protein
MIPGGRSLSLHDAEDSPGAGQAAGEIAASSRGKEKLLAERLKRETPSSIERSIHR